MNILGVAASPYCRKVWLAVEILGLRDRIGLVAVDLASKEGRAALRNPLGKVPVLQEGAQPVIQDSTVILDLLDDLSGGALIGRGPDRHAVLSVNALSDGILEAASLQVQEKRFHEVESVSEKWLAFQAGKVAKGLASLEASVPEIGSGGPRLDAVAVAITLLYLDQRFAGAWRADHPNLVTFLEAFSLRVPAFAGIAEATVFGG